jgi:hypothetical protein
MNKAVKILIIVVAVVLLIVISSGVFIGAGYILSAFLPLTLFEASLLTIGATFVIAFIISRIAESVRSAFPIYNRDDDDDDDYYDDDEDSEEEFDSDEYEHQPFVKRPTVGRNAPCPCGSEKKYKHCCGG